MTTYFDEKAREIAAFTRSGASPFRDDVLAWTHALRTDIAVCCEADRGSEWAFPADLRDRAYALFLRCSSDSWPCGVPGYGVDYEHDYEGMYLLSQLVEGLHDLFHGAAYRGWWGNDNPLAQMRRMDAAMEERCEALITTDPTLNIKRE